jgi:hypothetical protein
MSKPDAHTMTKMQYWKWYREVSPQEGKESTRNPCLGSGRGYIHEVVAGFQL